MPITRLCPECGKANKVNLTQVGTMVKCYACGEDFKVKSSDTTIRRQKSKPHPDIPDAPKVQASVALENAERQLKDKEIPPDVNFADERIEMVEDETDVVEEMEDMMEKKEALPPFVKKTKSLRARRTEREATQEEAPAAEGGNTLRRGFNRLGLVTGLVTALSYLTYKSNQFFPWYSPETLTTDMEKYIHSGAFAAALFLAGWLVVRLAGWAARGFTND